MPKGKLGLSTIEREMIEVSCGNTNHLATDDQGQRTSRSESGVKVNAPLTAVPAVSETFPTSAVENTSDIAMGDSHRAILVPGGVQSIATIIRLVSEKNYGFLSAEGFNADIFFSVKCCYGLFPALRSGDSVTCIISEGKKGYWARCVERVRK